MLRGVLIDAWPLALGLVFTLGALAVVAKNAARLVQRKPLAALHGDETGGVQSLSFVLTVPFFIMLMLLAVQITQLMIGLVVVHYAAFAAVRSASVWIPARMDEEVTAGENRIGQRMETGRNGDGTFYRIEPGFPKYDKIRQAAALACIPISPSRDVGAQPPAGSSAGALRALFAAVAPNEVSTNSRAQARLANKWAYASASTDIEITTFHRDDEPPLMQYYPYVPQSEFNPYEIGWRDKITVKVTHQFALLPGPGRLLAHKADESRRVDRVSQRIDQQGDVYTIELTASATLVGEGEKSVVPYIHESL